MEKALNKYFIPRHKEIPLRDYSGRKGTVLVIAPHPDDDVLGVGGTMLEASEEGRGVFSVYITDGRGSPRKDPGISDDEMATTREKEALSALKAVNAVGGFFLRLRSEELTGAKKEEASQILQEILGFLKPTEVFLPAPYERHPTHQACTQLGLEALRAMGDLRPALFGYSLWGAFWGGQRRIVRDISAFISKKVEAVLAHSSQIAYKNFQQGILGKNNYEAIFWESHEIQKTSFVEIFLDMNELLANKSLTMADFVRQDLEALIKSYW